MYRKRFIEELIEKKLRSTYCVNVVGPKFCGKTTTCEQFAKSKIKLISQDIIDVVKASPRVALEGERLRLIDEWQTAPILWDKIRDQADTDEAKAERERLEKEYGVSHSEIARAEMWISFYKQLI